ncbi:hypothetical protein PAMP_009637 [Pampus punctatissimus]
MSRYPEQHAEDGLSVGESQSKIPRLEEENPVMKTILAMSRYCQEQWVWNTVNLHMSSQGERMKLALLSGDAGCGKSYAVSLLEKKLESMKVSVVVSAMTNKAAVTLMESGSLGRVYTFHKMMGFKQDLLDEKLSLEDFKLQYCRVHWNTISHFNSLHQSNPGHVNERNSQYSCAQLRLEFCTFCSNTFERLRLSKKISEPGPPPFVGITVLIVDEYVLMNVSPWDRVRGFGKRSQVSIRELGIMDPGYEPEKLRIFHQDKQQITYTAAYINKIGQEARMGQKFHSVSRDRSSYKVPMAWYEVLKQAAQNLPKPFSTPKYRQGVRSTERDYLTMDKLWVGCKVRMIWHMDINGIQVAADKNLLGKPGERRQQCQQQQEQQLHSIVDTEALISHRIYSRHSSALVRKPCSDLHSHLYARVYNPTAYPLDNAMWENDPVAEKLVALEDTTGHDVLDQQEEKEHLLFTPDSASVI